jgi:hypothetical protein
MKTILFALSLSLAGLFLAAAPSWAGQYANGDQNNNASDQLSHAARGYNYAVETFDGSRGPSR